VLELAGGVEPAEQGQEGFVLRGAGASDHDPDHDPADEVAGRVGHDAHRAQTQ
jgi:hypothetical protein